MRQPLQDLIDEEMPHYGPCGICGGSDARHRVLDAVAERVRAGDTPFLIAEDFGLSQYLVRRIGAEWETVEE